VINTGIPSRILRMPRRRQKIAIKRLLQARLDKFVGEPNSPVVRVNVLRVIFDAFGMPHADMTVQPRSPVKTITASLLLNRQSNNQVD
jgi:hypothetical protein